MIIIILSIIYTIVLFLIAAYIGNWIVDNFKNL